MFGRNKDTERLIWLMKHSFYPSCTNNDGKGYGFGTMPKRKTIREAIDDAITTEKRDNKRHHKQ